MRIYFSPDCPKQQDYSIIAMIHYLGYSVAKTPEEPFDIGYLWQDATLVTPSDELLNIAKEKTVLNINCTDISKQKVDKIWHQVCGYSSLIDPVQYHGKAIRKYNNNGQGGGEIIDCPIKSSNSHDEFIYQMYIQTNPKGPQLEYRVPIVMGCMPLVFEVFKDDPELITDRKIKNQYKHSIKPKETEVIFNALECEQIMKFCQIMGFDIGELDILRCTVSNKIYVLDVNTTPTYFNMFNRYWHPQDKRKAIALVSETFESRLMEHIDVC